MKTVGITGSIACGKTQVSQYLSDLGWSIIDTDVIAHQILTNPNDIKLRNELMDVFGYGIFLSDGSLNKKSLSSQVFSDNDKRLSLNSIMHWRVREVWLKLWSDLKFSYGNNSSFRVAIVIPLMHETKSDQFFDTIWCIAIDRDLQVIRLMKRNEISEEYANRMIDSQMSIEEKIKLSTDVIWNNSTKEELWKNVNQAIEKYEKQTK